MHMILYRLHRFMRVRKSTRAGTGACPYEQNCASDFEYGALHIPFSVTIAVIKLLSVTSNAGL